MRELTSEQIADALWLAGQQARAAEQADAPHAPPDPASVLPESGSAPRTQPSPRPPSGSGPPGDGARAEAESQDEQLVVFTATPAVSGTFTGMAGWPAVPAVNDPVAICRALRAFKQTVGSKRTTVPDEEATAERAAEDGLWLPVHRPAEELRWDLVVVVDDAPSMRVWQRTVAEFVGLLQRLGAFRTVHVRLFGSAGTKVKSVTLRGVGEHALPHSAKELLDSSGRRVVLLLTDGAGPAWWSGAALEVLRGWGRTLPVAIVHMLPQERWHHGAIRATRVRLHAPEPGAATARTSWVGRDRMSDLDGVDTASSVAVPVLELDARWLRPWAELVARGQPQWVNLTAALAGRPEPLVAVVPAGSTGTGQGVSARDRVAQFRAMSSPVAFRLATHLAAAPLNLPVAHAIQAILMPRSRISHLSEVLNSDLLQPVGAVADADAYKVTMDFQAGVREELLSYARRADTMRVVHAVDGYLGPLVEAARGIGAAILEPDAPVDRGVSPEAAPYVRVEQAVLQALSGPYLDRSRQLLTALKDLSDPPWQPAVESPSPMRPGEARMTTTKTPPVPESPLSGNVAGPTTVEVSSVKTPTAPVQPAVWGNVPPRNPNFTGRTELLSLLHDRLRAGTTAVLPEALHGMGGVGKSQLAVEYVYRHQTDYELIWWIPAERPAQIGQAMSELAQRLSLPVGAEVNAAVPAIKEALRVGRPHANWLLVFDNAENPAVVRSYFPSGGEGSILVTSRDPGWAAIARSLEVNVFTRAESIALLRRRGPELNEHDADRLAVALGDLPLAIEQAAAWRAETGMPAEEYLRLLEEKRPELLDEAKPHDYPTTVAAAWNVSLDALKDRNLGALRLLQLCAFLAPEPISRTLLTGARQIEINPELDATLRDPIQFSRAIREISRYALARIDHRDQSIQMHRLVQRVLIGQMSAEQRNATEHGAHLLLAAGDPGQPDDAANWPRYGALYSHISTSGSIECENGWVRKLVLNEARYFWRWGDPLIACDLSERAYEVWCRLLGEDHLETLEMARWLGFMLFAVGRYTEAAELNAGTLEAYRRTTGEDHEDTLEALQAVAADRRAQGRFHTSLEISDDVYSRSVRLFGIDDPLTLRAAHNLGVSLRLAGQFQRAKELDEATWQRSIQIFGEDHPDTLYTRLGLIIDQRELGEYVSANAALEELVARHRLLLGEDNFFTLRAVRTLTVTRRKAGDHLGALECSVDAERRFAEQWGPGHPETMAAALDLSTDRRQNGELRVARDLGTSTYERYRSTFGEEHPHTVAAAVNVATTMRLMGDVNESYDIDLAGHRRLAQSLGDNHVLTLSCGINLASDLFVRGDIVAAYERDQITHATLVTELGVAHPLALACAVNRAMDLRALGRQQESTSLHDETIARFRAVLGDTHPATREATEWRRAHCDMYPMPL